MYLFFIIQTNKGVVCSIMSISGHTYTGSKTLYLANPLFLGKTSGLDKEWIEQKNRQVDRSKLASFSIVNCFDTVGLAGN